MMARHDKICGRCATTMKSSVALSVLLTSAFLEIKHIQRVCYALFFMEVECTSVPYLTLLKKYRLMTDGYVIKKAVCMSVYCANTGFASWEADVEGKVIDSSLVTMKS
ncbi:acetylornithine deacetylase-like protein [Leishmania tarentolae]|uniref:Acetylornithine deacetylase-like protein n=1 Tax=Leishmania tarentolae TaxID=5689 RepID=A0A640KNN0_LEITA|nr:acetylornithine deacetylase-like protein [Leishmania tarentolae]